MIGRFSGINIARLDLLSLRLALACANAGSMTHGASFCHMSLSNASQRLSRLEDGLGVSLFYRRRKGLEPTEAGRVVIDVAERILQQLDQMVIEVQCAPRPNGDIHENCGRAGRIKSCHKQWPA